MKTYGRIGRLVCGGLVMLGALAVGGCFSSGDGGKSPTEAASNGVRFSYTMEACNPLSRQLMKPAEFPPDAVTVSGTTMIFHHTLNTYCNAKTDSALHVASIVDGQEIFVNEVFRGDAVRCVCPFPIHGRIEGLAPGTYAIHFVYGAELNGMHQEPIVLYETTVTIPG